MPENNAQLVAVATEYPTEEFVIDSTAMGGQEHSIVQINANGTITLFGYRLQFPDE